MPSCITCDSIFTKINNNQKYCSDKCRYASPVHFEKRRTDRKNLRISRLSLIRSIKTSVGCEICGYNEHPAALQFDHIDPETKSFEISKGHSYGLQSTLDEIEKCRVLCANCHAIHSYNQRNSLSALK